MVVLTDILDGHLKKAGYGGIYDVSDVKHEIAQKEYQHFIRAAAQLGTTSRGKVPLIRPFPGAKGILAANSNVGACCFRLPPGGGYYVTLSQGAFGVMAEVFDRLLAEPDVFPWLGKVDEEEGGRCSKPLSDDLRQMDVADHVEPRSPARQFASTWMALAAIKFITVHEHWHVMSGYVDFFGSVMKTPSVPEQSRPAELAPRLGMPSPSLLLQNCELEADGYAACNVMHRWLGPGGKERLRRNSLFKHARDPELALFQLEFAAIHGVLKVLSKSQLPIQLWPMNTHPPLLVRRLHMSRAVQEMLFRWGHDHIAKSQDVYFETLDVIDYKLHAILGHAPYSPEWIGYMKPFGQIERYMYMLKALTPEVDRLLDPLSYVDRNRWDLCYGLIDA